MPLSTGEVNDHVRALTGGLFTAKDGTAGEGPVRSSARREVHPLLDPLEAQQAMVVEGDDLAVDERIAAAPRRRPARGRSRSAYVPIR